jgi:hypothetical protein
MLPVGEVERAGRDGEPPIERPETGTTEQCAGDQMHVHPADPASGQARVSWSTDTEVSTKITEAGGRGPGAGGAPLEACVRNRPWRTGSAGNMKTLLILRHAKSSWDVGLNATIRDNVTVAAGCMIAAGSLVTADTVADTVYAGSPARPRRLDPARFFK